MEKPVAQRTKSLLAGVALMVGSLGLAGCLNFSSSFDGETLDELDKSGSAPTEIGLAGPDDIVLTVGDTLAIKVEGDADVVETLRFRRKGNALTIGRDSDGNWTRGKAIVRVTMPAPRDVSLAGSGDITAQTLAEKSEVSIAGSGAVRVGEIASDSLEINVAGSGSLEGSGTVSTLEISIAGSGDIDFAEVTVDTADISIAGSGDIALASDGTVEASILGSGDVVVTGNATCKSDAVGSGTMTCKPKAQAASADEATETGEAD